MPTTKKPVDLQPVLIGDLVELRPLRSDDFDKLYAVASDPRIWEQHPESTRYRKDVFSAFFDGAINSAGAFLILDRSTGQVIGSSRYYGHDPVKREIEIGWTFLACSHWGGRYNGEVKQLMINHAFGFVDRIVFLVGVNNVRSQRAVERIGGRKTGTRVSENSVDSVIYEITEQDYSSRQSVPSIVRAIPGDIGAVLNIVKACALHMQKHNIDQWDDLYPTYDILLSDINEGNLWVLKSGNSCLGIIVLNEVQSPQYYDVPWVYQEPALVVHRLAVDPEVQGGGIASQLMDFAESYGRAHAYSTIRLDTFQKKPRAVSLYRKRGYREAGTVQFRKGDFYVFEKSLL